MLFDAAGLEEWQSITSVQIEKGVDGAVMLELQNLALQLSSLSYQGAENLILNWSGDTSIKKVLTGLLEDDFLWSSAPFNEHELLSHVFDPFLKAYICSAKGSVDRWYVHNTIHQTVHWKVCETNHRRLSLLGIKLSRQVKIGKKALMRAAWAVDPTSC